LITICMLIDELELFGVPERPRRPRQTGITIALDKGLAPRQVEDFLAVAAPHVDFVKLGWGSALITPGIDEKLAIYRAAGVPVYLGGTSFELFYARRALDQYERLLDRLEIGCVEVSDGAIDMPAAEKLRWISHFAKDRIVFSEVGSKDAAHIMPPYRWVESIRNELEAGSWKVICEARESGTAGVFRPNGEVRSGLIDEIVELLDAERVVFEAPRKEQQVWFLRHLGTDVNLGNIRPDEVLPLETLRLGLRADTLALHLGNVASGLRKARQDQDEAELPAADSIGAPR
jgi:phosphosulfolactate synthase